ncbi:MAG: CoA ester lyase [Sphingobium sp.]
MKLRSLLFVPGDRPERMEKALGLGADALILDLEDAVAPDAKPAARAHVAAFLSRPRDHGVTLMVRINALGDTAAQQDLDAVMPARPDAIMLPKAEGAASIEAAVRLMAAGAPVPILPIAPETAGALFTMGDFPRVSGHLCGVTWGGEDLSTALGAVSSRDEHGVLTDASRLARVLALGAAAASGVPAIETVYPDFRDLDGLARFAAAARREGFAGMMAIHPAQVPVINAAFTPDEAAIAHARAVVQAFADNPGKGVLTLNGKMIDMPHLKQARAILECAE